MIGRNQNVLWEEILRLQSDAVDESVQNLARARRMFELWLSPPAVRVGLTPKEVIFQENKVKLYRYRGGTPVKPIPVLIVYALINRLYILDLYPGRSFIEYLVNEGLQVYAVDWGVPGDEDRSTPFDYFVEGYLDKMVKRVIESAGVDQITLFGYCIGGTLASIYAALHPERVRNLVLLTTPIDFSKGGYLKTAVHRDHFPVDALVDTYGNIPPWLVEAGFKILNPLGDVVKWRNFWKHVTDDDFLKNFLAIEKWLNDNVPFPGEAYRKFIKELYQENRLIKGTLEMNGRRVDLRRITANHLSVAGQEDQIVPPDSAIRIKKMISSKDNEAIVLPGGHVGVIIGGRALKTAWPRMASWMLERSQPGP